jgi:hypothetical protein
LKSRRIIGKFGSQALPGAVIKLNARLLLRCDLKSVACLRRIVPIFFPKVNVTFAGIRC